MGMPKAVRQLIDGLPPVTVTDSSISLSLAAHAGRIVNLSRAAGIAVTLPAATGSGAVFRLRVATTISSNTTTVKAASASDSFTGLAIGVDTDAEGATGYTWNADSGDDTVTMSGTATGGVAGDVWQFEDAESGVWQVFGNITQSGASEATPFSATVS